jgi:hypothetical protein
VAIVDSLLPSFPRSAWERKYRRSASSAGSGRGSGKRSQRRGKAGPSVANTCHSGRGASSRETDSRKLTTSGDTADRRDAANRAAHRTKPPAVSAILRSVLRSGHGNSRGESTA